ncbi:MAG: hypothetical protein MJK15_21835 [Colwellia sp.]|nr:hypothetical protein [Colwellia sp.]
MFWKAEHKSTEKNLCFYLVELFIILTIIEVLAVVAYPSYTDFVLGFNSLEAQRVYIRLANLQEQVFVDRRLYAEYMMD